MGVTNDVLDPVLFIWLQRYCQATGLSANDVMELAVGEYLFTEARELVPEPPKND